MIQRTSFDAFRIIRDNGLLSRRRFQVYEIMADADEPLTGAEVARRFRERHGRTAASETVRNRITELVQLGVVAHCGYQVDTSTGMNVMLWRITAALPGKIVKRVSRRQLEAAAREALAAMDADGGPGYQPGFRMFDAREGLRKVLGGCEKP